jgi:hypothetical protein
VDERAIGWLAIGFAVGVAVCVLGSLVLGRGG